MVSIFLKLLNMSITAGQLVPVIILLRLLLRKSPKAILCGMWMLVAMRLITPFSFESVWSLIPNTEPITQEFFISTMQNINNDLPLADWPVDSTTYYTLSDDTDNVLNTLQTIIFITSVIWILGTLAILIYMFVHFFCIHKKICEAIKWKDNIWICDHIAAPFIIGVISPRIYLPSTMNNEDLPYVILHEKAHLERYDHIWKFLGYLLLAIYWFNPMLWIAYILFCRDVELACDEKVIRIFGTEIKKPYSRALINCSMSHEILSSFRLSFQGGSVETRIKEILNYKKSPFWITALTFVVCIIMSVCFLSDPKSNSQVDLSDIPNMNIGSEMPKLLYGNETVAIFQGVCGIIIYDISDSTVADRLTVDFLKNKGIFMLNAGVSENGKTILIGNIGEQYKYMYDTDKHTIKNYVGNENDIYMPKVIEIGYDKTYDKYFDFSYLISSTVIENSNNFMYLRANIDWSMSSLQIVIYDYNIGSESIYNIFD